MPFPLISLVAKLISLSPAVLSSAVESVASAKVPAEALLAVSAASANFSESTTCFSAAFSGTSSETIFGFSVIGFSSLRIATSVLFL